MKKETTFQQILGEEIFKEHFLDYLGDKFFFELICYFHFGNIWSHFRKG